MRLRSLIALPLVAAALIAGPATVITDNAAAKPADTSVSNEAGRTWSFVPAGHR